MPIKTKAPKKVFTDAQARAVGYYFGIGNLDLMTDKEMFDIIKKYLPDYDRAANALKGTMGHYAESDEMFEGMIEECQHWVKEARAGDKFVVQEWKERAKEFGIPEDQIIATA